MIDIVNNALDNPIFPAIGFALAATIGALWVAGAWWTYRDATWRTGSPWLGMLAAGWIVLSTPPLLPLSLGVYALARPQHTAAEGRSRRLVEELVERLDAEWVRCPACAATIDAEWVRCPACATWLAAPCANCNAWSDRTLEACPWCGSEQRDEPAVVARKAAAAAPGSRKPRRRKAARQPVGVMALDLRQPRARREALLDARQPARAGSR
jgi:hypothetical protein